MRPRCTPQVCFGRTHSNAEVEKIHPKLNARSRAADSPAGHVDLSLEGTRYAPTGKPHPSLSSSYRPCGSASRCRGHTTETVRPQVIHSRCQGVDELWTAPGTAAQSPKNERHPSSVPIASAVDRCGLFYVKQQLFHSGAAVHGLQTSSAPSAGPHSNGPRMAATRTTATPTPAPLKNGTSLSRKKDTH